MHSMLHLNLSPKLHRCRHEYSADGYIDTPPKIQISLRLGRCDGMLLFFRRRYLSNCLAAIFLIVFNLIRMQMRHQNGEDFLERFAFLTFAQTLMIDFRIGI